MDPSAPLERFKPTTGLIPGWLGMALVALVIGWVVVAEHSALGLRIGLGAAFTGVLVWVTQLRPRVTAYPDALLMHGSVVDVTVPYVLVDEVTMGQTLNVWAGGRRYVCVGIGKSLGFDTRQNYRSQRSGGLLGANRTAAFEVAPATSAHPSPTYQGFVLNRINDLVADARGRRPPTPEPLVRRVHAVPEIAALVLTGVAFAASLLL